MAGKSLPLRVVLVLTIAVAPAGGAAAEGECPASTRITASDPAPFDSFGRTVAISGDVVVIGARFHEEDDGSLGAAYVFRCKGTEWFETQKLLASDVGGGFGSAVAFDGNTILIGASSHSDADASGTGAVYVFQHRESSWVEVQELFASDGAPQDAFGATSVDVSGDVAVVGASNHNEAGHDAGAAYVFRFDPATSEWIEDADLTASDSAPNDFFGSAVAVSGEAPNRVVIGATRHNDACPQDPNCASGAAYVFRYDPETESWFEEQKLLASDAAASDSFGRAVALSGEVALIGAPDDDNDNDIGSNSGSVYVFRFDPETSQWGEQQKLLASDGKLSEHFGHSVAIDGDLAVVGARRADGVEPNSGAAYVFRFNGESWVEVAKHAPEPNYSTQEFGWSVALDGNRTVVGAQSEDLGAGAAYAIDLAFSPADLDADGDVDAFDLAQLLGAWGACPEPCTEGVSTCECRADFDNDCAVSAFDLATLLGSWGPL